ncbi:bifunctional folylpolyglutamate synthase/dihydrofolate synthase [Periweissella fabalis]|uniref:tetrahydrofolate synthase n=1 Tax=Periweissella fabalis TaxID=1070421 RepID=A0A7X6N3D2_9LACO|nr:folylpolyglutamate synthase/dihydrofolate synthase family protein [Periweissella fabalis]MCM0598900.1 bifunctional folylpolyglutamate synthase/dihydrofolate synthase [Periweissella fabalis]NKZ24562.1 bifunctional folylpolyglutamate synthase/dihydrofolate synthase [Periweissella fabalis]
MVTTYAEAIDFIHGRMVWKKTPTFDRMDALLDALGNPQNTIKGIHITGTNGKGSTTAYLRDILINSGLSVGTYTSPFITKFNERISVNGEMISDTELLELVQQIEPFVIAMDASESEGGPTEFEVITAMMFLYFATHPVDIVIIEVGIGGLFDSTNVFTPILSIITSVGYDHMHVLGNSLTAIAQQKAAIIKPHVPVIYGGHADDEAGTVIKATAHQLNVPFWSFDDMTITLEKGQNIWHEAFNWTLKDDILSMINSRHLTDLEVNMLGKYQVENASLAILAFYYLTSIDFVTFNETVLFNSLKGTHWPGRFETLQIKPRIVIDGAHNVAAINGLQELFKRKFNQVDKITVIFAALADKEFAKMANELAQIPNVELIATEFIGPGKRTVVNEDEVAIQVNQPIKTASNWQDALKIAAKTTTENGFILLTGSLYFVSEVRAYFAEKNKYFG